MLWLLLACMWGGDTALPTPEPVLRDGDLVFQTSRSAQSEAIKLATRSRYSHMGMIAVRGGRLFVFEASSRVMLTPFRAWVARGEGGHVVVKRLRDEQRLTKEVLRRMESVGKRFLSRPYDLWFRWDDQRMYCSELVYKVYDEGAGIKVGKLQRARDFDLSSPAVQAQLRRRFPGATFPPDEPLISPQSMWEDPQLVTVYER